MSRKKINELLIEFHKSLVLSGFKFTDTCYHLYYQMRMSLNIRNKIDIDAHREIQITLVSSTTQENCSIKSMA